MSKLYGPDEGYEVVKSRSSKNTNTNKLERKVSQHVSLYSKVRGKISDLICDQEPVLHGSPFNPVVDLDSLSHEQFITRARRVITELNPEGHPPPGVSSPTMMNLIDRLEVSKNEESSYASVLKNGSPRLSPSSVQSYNGSVLSEDRSTSDEVDDIDDNQTIVNAAVKPQERVSPRTKTSSPKKTVQRAKKMKVFFAPLNMSNTLDFKNSQYAISTVQEKSAPPRRAGSREVILTERLGDFYTGNKKLTSSAVHLCAAPDDNEDVDELREYYQRKEQRAFHRATMVRGRHSMVDEAEDEAIVTDELMISDDHAPIKRRTVDNRGQDSHDALYQDDEPREEFKSQPTQELLLDVPPRPTTTRAIIARQTRIDRAAIRKVVSNTVIAPTPITEIDAGYNSEMFYELAERNEVFQQTVIDYVEPPYHDDSVLWNEDIGQDEFVLPKKDWDNHSDEERHVYNEAQSRYEYLHQHRACFHEVYSIEDIIPTIQELPSDLHLYLVMTGSALTNCRWSTHWGFEQRKLTV